MAEIVEMHPARLVERDEMREKLAEQLREYISLKNGEDLEELTEFVLSVLCEVVGDETVKSGATDMELYYD